MGRGKIEIKKIENQTNRQVTFSKRRGGLLKKAKELAILCDAQIGVVIFSSSGKLYEYASPHLSIQHIIDRYQSHTNRYQSHTNSWMEVSDNPQITWMRSENERLQASMRQYTGEDLTALTVNDLNQLERQLELSANKVRARKHQLLCQQLDNLHQKERILDDENSTLSRAIVEHQAAMEHQKAAADHKVGSMDMFDHFPHFFQEEQPRSLLQLSPQLHTFRLQPTQPNLQEACFHGHGLQL